MGTAAAAGGGAARHGGDDDAADAPPHEVRPIPEGPDDEMAKDQKAVAIILGGAAFVVLVAAVLLYIWRGRRSSYRRLAAGTQLQTTEVRVC